MNTNPLIEGRKADSARRRQRVIKAIKTARRAGTAISVSGIARQAGVDRAFLYRHKDLLAQVHAAGAEPPGDDAGPVVSRASLQADLANALDDRFQGIGFCPVDHLSIRRHIHSCSCSDSGGWATGPVSL